MTDGPAAYSLYDVLRSLADRVGWPSEAEKRVVQESIDAAERANILGNLASSMACAHPEESRTMGGKCADCGRQIENTQWQGSAYRDRWSQGDPQYRYNGQSGRGW